MRIGICMSRFSWDGGGSTVGAMVERVVRGADEVGVHSAWVMDHFFQIPTFGAKDEPMLESYATIAFVAGRTERLEVGALVTGVSYRHPGVLVKSITTLDVLSGGRVWMGIGAAWNEEEAVGLGIPFPPLRVRYEQLEETLQVAHLMWSGDTSPYDGRQLHLAQPINVPGPVRRPHPPVLIGGAGERRTLRLVAQYADACNLFEFIGNDEVRRKLDVLRQHCEDVGRDYESVVKTTYGSLEQQTDSELAARFTALAGLGVDLAILEIPGPEAGTIDLLRRAVRIAEPLGRRPSPILEWSSDGSVPVGAG